jgi:hypothetical protein
MTRSFDPVVLRLLEIIHRALPDAAEKDWFWAYHFLSGALILTISETDRINRLSKGKCSSTDIRSIEPRMIEFAASADMSRAANGMPEKSAAAPLLLCRCSGVAAYASHISTARRETGRCIALMTPLRCD